MHAFLLAVTLAAATGGAKPAKSAQPPQPAAKHIDIDDDEVVEGDLTRGGGEEIFARKVSRFGTLIKLRADFRDEMMKSAE
jgi:hypothetical protein